MLQSIARYLIYANEMEIEALLQNFLNKTLSVTILYFSKWQILRKGAFSNDLKGMVMENIPGGKPPDPHFCFLHSHIVSAPNPI